MNWEERKGKMKVKGKKEKLYCEQLKALLFILFLNFFPYFIC